MVHREKYVKEKVSDILGDDVILGYLITSNILWNFLETLDTLVLLRTSL